MPDESDPPKKGRPTFPEWLKSWTAALGTLLAITVVVVVGSVAVWRDQRNHSIAVEVTEKTDATLQRSGVDLDLKQALIDAVNQEVRAVKRSSVLTGKPQEAAPPPTGSVSFEPFGLKMTTLDVTSLVRFVTGGAPPPAVRMELVCAADDCRSGGTWLTVDRSGAGSSHRAQYPLQLGSAGLRRSLDQAIRKTADQLLEDSEPLIASIADLDMGSHAIFADERERDYDRAAALASALDGRDADAKCFGDLVPGLILIFRNQALDGAKQLTHGAKGGDNACKMRIGSTSLFLLALFAECRPAQDERQLDLKAADGLVEKLATIKIDEMPALANRVQGSRMMLELAHAVQDEDDETRLAACLRSGRPEAGTRHRLASQVTAIAGHLQATLPPNFSPVYEHSVLAQLLALEEYGVPRMDVLDRYTIIRAMLPVVAAYAHQEQHPRSLFMLLGRLNMDTIAAAHDAMAFSAQEKTALLVALGANEEPARTNPDGILQSAIQISAAGARAAFGSAAAADTVSQLEEPSPDIEPLTSLGDALYALGDVPGAADAYARAVEAFIGEDEPVDETVLLAAAASHWASLRGWSCKAGPDALWDSTWAKLGGGGCGAASVLGVVRPLLDAAAGCAPAQTVDEATMAERRVAAVECLRRSGAGDAQAVRSFVTSTTADMVNRRYQEALANVH